MVESEEKRPAAVPLQLEDERWERLMALTGGEAGPCYQCGVCTATCPWGLVRQETLSVRSLIHRAQLGLAPESDQLWLCTTCAQCEASCPRGVRISAVMGGLRQLAWEERQTPAGLPAMLWSLFWNENPWSQPPSQRHLWAKDLDLPLFDPDRHEILLYVGCTASYDRRAQQIARALVRVLRAAGVRFGVLGEAEPCCGEAALSLGHRPYFSEIARQTAARFAERGVTRLVVISPHCHDAFTNHYPAVRGDEEGAWAPVHYTRYLAELLGEGRLTLDHPLALRVTYHDPCYLARRSGEWQASRQLLEAIAGLELVEMERNGPATLCCGGGGGRMWLETAAGERFADLRVAEALQTGAELLATACPFCVACLEDSVKAGKVAGLNVADVAEILARVVGDPDEEHK